MSNTTAGHADTLKDIPGIVDSVDERGRVAVYTGQWEWWQRIEDGSYSYAGEMTEDEALRHLF